MLVHAILILHELYHLMAIAASDLHYRHATLQDRLL